jgi:REP-associated tyrosine transposase
MSRPRRITGVSYLGHCRYFLTICAKARFAAFLDDAIARSTIDQFLITAREEGFAVLAYCLMPDHIHLLVEGTALESDLRRFVKVSKQQSGFNFARIVGRSLWQDGYFEHVLRRDEDARAIARYIIENPVRAGIVERPTDYRYLGSSVWEIETLLVSSARS